MGKALTENEKKARATAAIRLSSALLHEYSSLEELERDQAESGIKLGLKYMLGREFTRCAGQIGSHWTLPGQRYKSGTQDHVVPLGVLINYLIRRPELGKTPEALRKFLNRSLVTAYIPRPLNEELRPKYAMPKEVGDRWYTARGNARLDFLWSRYAGLHDRTLPVLAPHQIGSAFQRLPQGAELHGHHKPANS